MLIAQANSRRFWGFVTALGCLLAPTLALGQTVGITHTGGQILGLELTPDDDDDITWFVIADTEVGGLSGGLTSTHDGTLFSTSSWWPNPDRLAILDPESGRTEFIGEVPSAFWADLAYHEGELWITQDSGLFKVDPSHAELTEVSIGDESLHAIASDGENLFGIVGGIVDLEPLFHFARLDLETGTATPLAELQGIERNPCFAEFPASMVFDEHGGLWVVMAEFNGTCIVPFITSSFQYFPNPSTGEAGVRKRLAEGAPGLALAIDTAGFSISPVDAPVLHPVGMLALVLLISGAAVRRLRFAGP